MSHRPAGRGRAVSPPGRGLPRRALRGEPDALLERIADTLAELIPYEDVHIYEADEAKRELIPVLARSKWEDEVMRETFSFGEGITGWAVDAPGAGAREQGAPRPPRALRARHAGRAGGADRGPAHRPRADQGNAQHLPRRRGREFTDEEFHARDALRGRGCARDRQRAHPRPARAPGVDRRADRPLQPPRLPRPAAPGGHARVGGARHGRPRDARPRRLQEGERRLRPRRRRPAPAPGRGRPPVVGPLDRRRVPRSAARSSRSSFPRATCAARSRSPSASARSSGSSRSRRPAASPSRPVSRSGPTTLPTRASSSPARRRR